MNLDMPLLHIESNDDSLYNHIMRSNGCKNIRNSIAFEKLLRQEKDLKFHSWVGKKFELLEYLFNEGDLERAAIFIKIFKEKNGFISTEEAIDIITMMKLLYRKNSDHEIFKLIPILEIRCKEEAKKIFGSCSLIDLDFCENAVKAAFSEGDLDDIMNKQVACEMVSIFSQYCFYERNRNNYSTEFCPEKKYWHLVEDEISDSDESDTEQPKSEERATERQPIWKAHRSRFENFLERAKDLFPPCTSHEMQFAKPMIEIRLKKDGEKICIMKMPNKRGYVISHPRYCFMAKLNFKKLGYNLAHFYPGHSLEKMKLSQKMALSHEYWNNWQVNLSFKNYQDVIHPAIIQVVDSLVGMETKKNACSIIDLCGGSGFLAEKLIEELCAYEPPLNVFYRIYENNESSLKKAKEKAENCMQEYNKLNFQVTKMDILIDLKFCDADGDPLSEASQDFIIASGALNESVMPSRAAALKVFKKVARLVKFGGYCIFTGVSKSFLFTPDFHNQNFKIFNTHLPMSPYSFYLVQKTAS